MEQRGGEEEFTGAQSESEGDENFGFSPMEDPVEDEKKKRAREESEESKQLKKDILRMVARYPSLELRTSKLIMDKLNEMDEDELRMVRDNCMNDLAEKRGTPVSAFVLFCITQPIDYQFLPGYTEQCMSDIELKRDVETEMISIFGDLSNRVNIFFRLLNNAYITWKKLKGDPIEYATGTVQESNESNGTNRGEKDDIATGFSKQTGKSV